MLLHIATSRAFADQWHPDDEQLVEALQRRGVFVERVVWGTPVRGPVLIRTTWDYYLSRAEFVRWLEQCDLAIHSPETVSWNSDKLYLLELQAAGHRVVPTVTCDGPVPFTGPVVVKPNVSANAFMTRTFDRFDASAAAWAREIAETGRRALVQPFWDEVTSGEVSLIFFDGEYSHAVRKRPADGDFRVQENHGGRVDVYHPDANVITQASAYLTGLDTAYARVDGLLRSDEFFLMELELIEPELFIRTNVDAAERFADALLRRLVP